MMGTWTLGLGEEGLGAWTPESEEGGAGGLKKEGLGVWILGLGEERLCPNSWVPRSRMGWGQACDAGSEKGGGYVLRAGSWVKERNG